METLSVEEVAKRLRQMAELTAKASQNWNNFEAICKDMLQAAYNAGKENKE
jgi:hypothetical protein